MKPKDDGMPANGLSWVRGTRDEPLIEATIPELLARTVARLGDAVAAVFVQQGIRRSWREFASDVDRMAAGLAALGIAKGDRVGIWSPNRYEWLVTQFATARIGAILVTINPAYRISELDYALRLTGCAAIVLSPGFKGSDYVAMLGEVAPELASSEPGLLSAAAVPALRHVIVMGADSHPGAWRFDDVERMGDGVDSAALDAITAVLDPNDAINIQFTSGTTGLPKGATLTHRNIVNNAYFVTGRLNLSEVDRLCIPVPFYHCFGMVMGTLGCVARGARMIVPGEAFDPVSVLTTVHDEGATALYGVPTMFVGMLEHPDFASFDLSTLRTGIMAGAPCPIEVMKKVQTLMHMREVTIAYGMTETSPVSFQSAIDTPLDKRVSSVGRIHPHVEVRIVDETGTTVPSGEQGELLTRGYSVMKGYWDDAAQTAAAIDKDGWMHTGDLARIDDEGYCNITGRVKDMICRGGENIYPREIEEFLYTHPDISQVQVFGIPDDRLGEIVCAWIVPKPGKAPDEAEIQNHCRGRIAHFKIPAVVRLRDTLPMTVTGKPQKFLMRATMMRELGLSTTETA